MDNKVNELLSQSVELIRAAEKVAMNTLGKPESVKHTHILKNINTIRWQLQECIDENQREFTHE